MKMAGDRLRRLAALEAPLAPFVRLFPRLPGITGLPPTEALLKPHGEPKRL